MSDQDIEIKAVFNALENTKYKWRTIEGIRQETNLTHDQILNILNKFSDRIIKSSIPSPEGKDLFTTRKHFRKSASTFEKVLGALKNRST